MTARTTPPPPLPPTAVAALRCSICGTEVTISEGMLRCARGHSFDRARQGYLNLLHAKVPASTADTSQMVAARDAFLRDGFYTPLAEALVEALAPQTEDELIIDAGAGTGYYLAFILERRPHSAGLALDVSAPALRRAARAHPQIAAVVWNLWQPWPVGSGVADVVLNVFAPRNADEFHRVLRPGGRLVVVVPDPGHLGELTEPLGLLTVDQDKQQRLDTALADRFTLLSRHHCGGSVTLSPAEARNAVLMGPNAHHLHRDGLDERLAGLTEPVEVTTSVQVSTYRRLP